EIETYDDALWAKQGCKPKAEWADGPWKHEPDKLVWKTKAGLPGMIVRNGSGALCGYAAVAEGHPAFDKGYSEIECDITVHGGLTYAAFCNGRICHEPVSGEPDHVFWFGFDCAHCLDIYPARYSFESPEAAEERIRRLQPSAVAYRDINYVIAE